MDDSFTFSFIIRQFSLCIDSQFIVSFDITSLFTYVYLYEDIFICADFLCRSLFNICSFFPWKCFRGIDGIGYLVSFLQF